KPAPTKWKLIPKRAAGQQEKSSEKIKVQTKEEQG
ncbi:hypothetical protein DBR06_SOUSAS9410084, partial [Sousa chinensis]